MSLSCSVAPHQEGCSHGPHDFFLYDTIPQARDCGADYGPLVTLAFRQDEQALRRLFRLTVGCFDGSGAESHAGVLSALLRCWGDERFSGVLRTEVEGVRNAVVRDLDFDLADDWSKEFPTTHALGQHQNPAGT